MNYVTRYAELASEWGYDIETLNQGHWFGNVPSNIIHSQFSKQELFVTRASGEKI